MLSQQQQAGVLETIEPPWPPLTPIKQYCESFGLNHGKIHAQANSTVISSAAVLYCAVLDPAELALYVIRRPSVWANLAELQAAGAKSAKIGNEEIPDRVRWIRSYVVKEPDGRLGSFCIL
jgi:hypothetical protein